MTAVSIAVALAYLLAAIGFVVALHLMNSPATARKGSRLSYIGMIVAVAAVLTSVIHDATITTTGWIVLSVGGIGGGAVGLVMARRVKMTDVPQVVSVFNAVGGGAAALVAAADFVRLDGGPGIGTRVVIATVLDIIVGPVTFSGSLIAAGKLQGWVSSRPVVFPGARFITAALTVVGVGAGCYLLAGHDSTPVLILAVCAALAFGVTMVMPIGGADMPVVVALLNSFTGIAVAIAGFVIDNGALIIGGALVGASGGILTLLMAKAMNRSILSVMIGGFGTGDGGAATGPAAAGAGAGVRRISAADAAIQLAYASKVGIVPGYGLAAAQAQHEAAELAALLAEHATVFFAIHPVAGRMPGHMNVLLAEANVPYPDLKEMDAANLDFPTTDVVLILGANDVTNPAARRPGNPVSGMPILNVDQAKNVIVIKRSMGHGYAGIDNELYTNPKTGMLFSDAKAGLADIIAAVKALVAS
jgi:proton-translocating NAD(P)+ transhydrogenase subunit beta